MAPRIPKREEVISVRLTPAEKVDLDRLARKWVVRASDLIRHLIREAISRDKVGPRV